MQKQIVTFDGNKFSNIEEFYIEVYSVLTKSLDWKVAHNFDAFNDILYGGFGVYEPKEKIIINWINYSKSIHDLGRNHSIAYYESRAVDLMGSRRFYFQKKADDLKDGGGETLLDTIVEIIKDHPNVQLVTFL